MINWEINNKDTFCEKKSVAIQIVRFIDVECTVTEAKAFLFCFFCTYLSCVPFCSTIDEKLYALAGNTHEIVRLEMTSIKIQNQ